MISRGLALATVLLLPIAAHGQQRERHGIVMVTPAVSPAPAKPVPIISLSVKDADLVEVVRSLARIAAVNVIIDPGVSGKVTAELVDVRWDHALAVILKTQGLAMELDGRILTVAPPRRLMGAH